MQERSLDWCDFSELVRADLRSRGVGPGDRFYIRALKVLSDDALIRAAGELGWPARPISTKALAKRFDRKPGTIANRLRRLKALVDRRA
jgi:hypothetical protein